jgi:hypothetical protein
MADPLEPKKTEWVWHVVAIGVLVLMVVLVSYGF